MKKRLFVPVAAALAVAITAIFASTAMAVPTQTQLCTSCHDTTDSSLNVSAVAGMKGATSTMYTVSVANPYGLVGWAVFQGANKVAGGSGTGGTVMLTNGVDYTVVGASLNGSGVQVADALSVTPATAQVTPPTPPMPPAPASPDTTAPVTTADAMPMYAGSAVIHLSAQDNASGSGIAHTYFVLDGAPQVEGTTVTSSVVGTHTLDFWSVDTSGNAETPRTLQFTVAGAQMMQAPVACTFKYRFATHNKTFRGLKGVMKNMSTGKVYKVAIPKRGMVTFKNLSAGKYKLSVAGNKRFKFKARLVTVRP